MWITKHEDQQLNVLYELKQVGMILAVFFDNLLSSQARNSWPKCNWPKRFPAALQKTFCYAVYLM